jgi:N-acetylglucosamine kinase-like BadF-type ATPase
VGLSYRLTNDVWAGLRAGSVAGCGVAINCGSGAGAVGRTSEGDSVIIPDLGYVFGDSGGGVQIGVDAVRAVVRAWDGRGSATALTELVLKLVGLPSVDALYLALYRDQLPDRTFRKCTKLVFQAASIGDAVATRILERIGDEFGVSALAIARRLNLMSREFPFVLSGGAIRTLQSPLAEAAVTRLRAECPRCVPVLPRLMPVAGAALMALDAGEAPVTEDHFLRFIQQGQAWHPEELFN